jgi:hypothetical protein
MSTLYGASLNLTKLTAAAKTGHSAFSKGKNGELYVNLNIWLNDTPDQYGNDLSLQLNSKKELRESEGKIYVGNGKKVQAAAPEAVKVDDLAALDDLPF